MTAEAQLVALLEWLGASGFVEHSGFAYWKPEAKPLLIALDCGPMNSDERPGLLFAEIPPLTLDLMHEAWRKLDYHQRLKFVIHLREACATAREQRPPIYADDSYVVNATKEQRLETLLKTIGKWVD